MLISGNAHFIPTPQVAMAQFGSTSSTSGSFQQYHSDKYGISIQYPLGWIIEDGHFQLKTPVDPVTALH
jgi:hypothetical protein